MKIMLSEVKKAIRNEIYAMMDEIVSKDVPNGTAWKLSGGKGGWAAKNNNGVTNYWYGDNEVQNKEKANKFRNDSTHRPDEKLKTEVGAGPSDGEPHKLDLPIGVDEHVRKRGSGYVVTNKSGSKVLGHHKSKKSADKQLAAIEINKHKHESKIVEKSPPGWSGTVKAMKKHKKIDNPWALANYMKKKGDTPHKKPEK